MKVENVASLIQIGDSKSTTMYLQPICPQNVNSILLIKFERNHPAYCIVYNGPHFSL